MKLKFKYDKRIHYNVEIDNSKHFNLNKLDFDISILLNKFKIFFRNIKSDINFNTIE